ncbi:division/cell wall cluster transcriptional repressor MraZ [Dehalobacter sp. TBBPA1]|uniref:division/cell wall cluster transcriptional repressor MraZ n=1 Tax=Dehalobacter sp. TBBPA1 TaxID=3235037 RepID=UPI0034A4706C
MFMGEFLHTIDNKGRLIIPAKFRELLGNKSFITKGMEDCLFLYPENGWLDFVEKLKQLPVSQTRAREFTRLFFSSAAECEFDKQGRILVPANLRERAFLEKDVVVVGVMDRIEVWDSLKWREYSTNAAQNYEDDAESLAAMGLMI